MSTHFIKTVKTFLSLYVFLPSTKKVDLYKAQYHFILKSYYISSLSEDEIILRDLKWLNATNFSDLQGKIVTCIL